MTGPVDVLFPLPNMETTSIVYYYQVIVQINSSLKMIIRSYYHSSCGIDDVMAPTYTVHNMDSGVMLEWYQVGIATAVFVAVIVALAVAIAALLYPKGDYQISTGRGGGRGGLGKALALLLLVELHNTVCVTFSCKLSAVILCS